MRACPAGLPVKAHAPALADGLLTSGFGRRPEWTYGRRENEVSTPPLTTGVFYEFAETGVSQRFCGTSDAWSCQLGTGGAPWLRWNNASSAIASDRSAACDMANMIARSARTFTTAPACAEEAVIVLHSAALAVRASQIVALQAADPATRSAGASARSKAMPAGITVCSAGSSRGCSSSVSRCSSATATLPTSLAVAGICITRPFCRRASRMAARQPVRPSRMRRRPSSRARPHPPITRFRPARPTHLPLPLR